MQNPPNKLRWFYALVGLAISLYGLKTIISQEISASGKWSMASGWALHGNSAVILGSVIFLFGTFFVYVALTAGNKVRK
jgi:hypothetical protein